MISMRAIILATWVGALAPAISCQAQCTAYAVDIYTGPQGCQILPSWAGARGINDAGDMCGGYNVCGGVAHPVIWHADGTVTELPLSADQGFPLPFDLNLAGQACGRLDVPSLSNPRAFRFSDGITANLGVLPGGNFSEAYAISANGRVCGYSLDSVAGPLQAFLWHDGTMSPIRLPLGPNAVAYDIDDSGEFICGWMGVDPSPHFGASAFRWSDGAVVDLGVLPKTTSSEARGVNNLGQVCGIAYTPVGKSDMIRHGFFWSNGVMQDIGILPGFIQCLALDLDDSGQVIGYCVMWPQNNVSQAFVWQNGVMQALEDLIPPELKLSNLSVWAINNAGQIAGHATQPSPLAGDETVAVRLTPIPSMPGDFNCDNAVNVLDLLGVINHWGYTTPNLDFNSDGTVNLPDLIIVLDNWTL